MEIIVTRNGTEVTIALEGRLDIITAPDLEDQIEDLLEGADKLIFDFAKLKYISSAGLRIMLTAMQIMEDKQGMVVKNVTPEVMSIFEVTGFIDDLTIE